MVGSEEPGRNMARYEDTRTALFGDVASILFIFGESLDESTREQTFARKEGAHVVWGESMGLSSREMQGVCGVWGKYIDSLV